MMLWCMAVDDDDSVIDDDAVDYMRSESDFDACVEHPKSYAVLSDLDENA